jgi:hypothetical protein
MDNHPIALTKPVRVCRPSLIARRPSNVRIKLRPPSLGETLIIFGMIGTAIAFLYDRRADINATLDWWRDDAALIGTWINAGEGSVDAAQFAAKSPEDVVWLSIEAKDGKFQGMIHTPRLCNALPWNYVRVNGSNSLWRTIGTAVEKIMSEDVVAVRFTLKRDEGFLILTPTPPTVLFPKAVRLVQSSENAEDQQEGVPPLCENNILEKLVKQRRSLNPTSK